MGFLVRTDRPREPPPCEAASTAYYRIQNITFLIRCTINAVTVIPLITLLVPQAIIAVITFIINVNSN